MARSSTTTKRLAAVTALLGLAAGPLAWAPAPAGAGGSSPAPTVTVSTADLEIGTPLTITGSGCVEGGSGSGLEVAAGLAHPDLPGQVAYPVGERATVATDGSWTIAVTVEQPLPTGDWLLTVGCLGPEAGALVFLYDGVPVTTTSPPVTGVVVDGDVLTVDDPCRPSAATPVPFITAYLVGPVATSSDELSLELIAWEQAGPPVGSFRVPETVGSGAYRLDLRCLASRASTPFAVHSSPIDWVAAPSSTTTPLPVGVVAPAPATPAAPIAGSASYTG